MTDAVLAINAGSSSIKFALFGGAEARPMASGRIEGIGSSPRMIAGGTEISAWPGRGDLAHEAFFDALFDWVERAVGANRLVAVGHRVVHGGTAFAAPEPVTPALLAALEQLSPLAPLHQPHNLAAIRAVAAARPELSQVACFDTAFHRTMPEVATRFALPRALHDKGVRRYGFHGLSYEYVARELRRLDPALADGRVIVAHLGNGASCCAMANGRSVDTTMGFTALDGLMMGTRCGSIDPGVVLHLIEHEGMSADDVTRLLYARSGLLGVSGLSGDVRALLASGEPSAREALELFAYRAAREVAALIGVLGGLDALVFTAGIGENAPPVRAAICTRLDWMDVALDAQANAANAAVINAPGSAVPVRIISTDEERMIALHTLETLEGTRA